MIAKAGLGLIGLSAISVGGVALAKPEWFGINKEIAWKPLSQDSDFSDTSNGYTSKFGGDHKNYLVGVKGNQDWWEESFEKLKRDSKNPNINEQPSNKFKYTDDSGIVTKGFDGSNDKALNQICKKVYKETTTNIKSNPGADNASEYKDVDVWKYCSPVGAIPKKVSEQTGEISGDNTSNWIGKTKEGELLSTKHPNNQELWKLKNDEFFGLGVFKTGTSKTAPTEKFFEALFNKEESKKDPYALKNKCEAAYKLVSDSTNASTDASKTKEEDVVKYCSLKSISQ